MTSTIPLIEYNIIQRTVKINSPIVIEQYCNSITIINIGITIAEVNYIPLNPGTPGVNNGESVAIGGNIGEIFNGRIDIAFPAGGVGSVIVIQKVYLPQNFKTT
jgi:hypothetical protein